LFQSRNQVSAILTINGRKKIVSREANSWSEPAPVGPWMLYGAGQSEKDQWLQRDKKGKDEPGKQMPCECQDRLQSLEHVTAAHVIQA